MTSPPFSLTALSPTLPSAPVPDRITQTARSPKASASELRKKSKGRRAPSGALRLSKPQHAVAHREVSLRRDDINAVALERHSLGGLRHLHCRVPSEEIDHHALLGGSRWG